MADHKHEWEIKINHTDIMFIKCKNCDLQVEIYPSHIAVYDYSKHDSTYNIGHIPFPK
jgi:hypothetical protein